MSDTPMGDTPTDEEPRDNERGKDFAADDTVLIPLAGHGADDSVPSPHPEDAESDPDQDRPAWVAPTIAGVSALLVGLLAGWLMWSGSGDGDDSEELLSLQTQVSDLTAENAELQGQADDLQGQADGLTAELDALGEAGGEKASTLEELTAANTELTGQVEAMTGDLEGLASEKETLAKELVGLEEENADLLEENADLRDQIEGIVDDIDASVVSAPDLEGGTATAGWSSRSRPQRRTLRQDSPHTDTRGWHADARRLRAGDQRRHDPRAATRDRRRDDL